MASVASPPGNVPLADGDRFLRAVYDDLPFDRAVSAEVMEELAAHIRDSTDALMESGLAPEEAQRRAVDAMGDPQRLAADIARAHQTTQRLLAAAGAGAWTAAKAGFRGLLVGYLVAMMIVLVVGATIIFVRDRLGQDLGAGITLTNASHETLVMVFALGSAAYVAARTTPPAIAKVSRRGMRGARVVSGIAIAGPALIIGLFCFSDGQSLLSVLGLLTLPIWALAGAWHADRPPIRLLSDRRLPIFPGVVLIGAYALMFLMTTGLVHDSPTGPGGPTEVGGQSDPYAGFRVAGDSSILQSGASPVALEARGAGANARMVTAESTGILPALDDLRIEVWPAADPSLPGWGAIDPSRAGPILTQPLDLRGSAQLVDFSQLREVGDIYILATGLSADRDRHLLASPVFEQVVVEHSAWEWLLAR